VLAGNLHGARQYGEIVTVLRDAGRGADAERWARRGLAEDPAGFWADGLREQLAGLLLASGRGGEAVCVHRAEFKRRTLHQDYSRLRDTAERAGQWPGLREWALEYLRARAQVKGKLTLNNQDPCRDQAARRNRARGKQEEETVMTDESASPGAPAAGASAPGLPAAVDRATFQAELDRLRGREKAHTREGDAIAAARRRLPMVEVDPATPLTGGNGPVTLLEAFDGRRQLIAYYFMWNPGHPAAEQCEGCTWVTTQVTELSYLHSRAITYAVFCQGPYGESARYRDFMGWDMPWYSAEDSLHGLLAGRQIGLFHLVCYLRDGDRVFETYWTKRRGAEAMDYSYALMDLTVYGRQEPWEDSPPGWPQQCSITRTNGGSPDWPPVPVWPGGRPIAQWPRLEAGRSDDLAVGP
jgi:predicted dithiol-disulfide oxidoreductase (DUF899 family)